MGLNALRSHLFGLDIDLEIDVKTAEFLILRIAEIFERLRVTRIAIERLCTKGSESFHRDNERRDRSSEILGEKWSERLVFPRLNIAGRPVVHKADTEDVIFRFTDRYRP